MLVYDLPGSMTPPTGPTSASSSEAAWTASELTGSPHDRVDKPERVRKMFTSIARRYDLNNRLHSFWRDQAWRRCAVRLAEIGTTDDVLDIACGTGDLTEAFADARPASVRGVDFTEAMLELARVKAESRRRRPNVPAPTYAFGDAMALEIEDASVDVVSIAFGIRNVADPDLAFREFRRVLRPGGRLIVLEFDEPSNPLMRWGNRLYTQRIMPLTATLIAGDRSGAYKYLPKSVDTFLSRDALSSRITDAGFADATQTPLTFGVCVVHRAVVR